MERRIQELEVRVTELTTFMIQSKALAIPDLPDKLNALENKLHAVEQETTVNKTAVVNNANDIEVILTDEKDKVKVWKRNTFALFTIIFGAIMKIIFDGHNK